MTNAWIAGLILLLVAVAVVIPTVQTSISKATVPYYIANETNGAWSGGILSFAHQYILNGTEQCYNGTAAGDTITRDVNYTMNYQRGQMTNISVPKPWGTGTFNCTYWYGDESYMTQPVNRNLMGVFMVFLVLGVLLIFMRAIGLM